MKKVVVANPPLGIYKNEDITIGQAAYMIPLDANTRARKELLGENVSFPSYAFNVFGNRGDFFDNPGFNADEYRAKGSLRERLNLVSDERLSDDEGVLMEGVTMDFKNLKKACYLLSKGDSFYLDCARIKKNYSVDNLLDGVKMEDRTRNALERYWNNNMDYAHAISKPTEFSISNPFGGENVGPLFGVANMWGHRYPGSDIIMAGSERNLTNYIFLRGLTQLALNGRPGMKEIYVYPQVDFAEGFKSWDLDSLTKDEFSGDILRYAILTTKPRGGKSFLNFTKLREGEKFVNLIGNLGKVLEYSHQVPTGEEDIVRPALDFKLGGYVGDLRKKLGQLSARVKISKNKGTFEVDKNNHSRDYSLLLNETRVVAPKISERIMI